MDYQILVFENQDIYTSEIVSADEAVDAYVKMCYKYLRPEYVDEEYTEFHATERYVKYHDRFCDNKPMMILMTGVLTKEMITAIEEGLKDFYIRYCGECNFILDKTGVICNNCLNKV
jgi:hypothetical protein